MFNKTLLIISGGIEAVPGIELAKKMGLYVVVSDINPEAPGFKIADDTIIASTYNVEETLDAAKKYNKSVKKIDGVMCIASDVPLTVASVAAELGLPSIPIEAAKLAMDKLEMKNCFKQYDVPIPWYKSINCLDELKKYINEKGFPLVIKPVDSRGARGVLRLTKNVDLEWAWNHAQNNSPTKRVMIEKFLEGPQVSTETMMIDGKEYTPGFSDRNYEFLKKYAPHIIENGGDLPSSLPDYIKEEVKNIVQKAALSMGIRNGIVKGDFIVHYNKPYVIELAARLSGGYFCTHEIPMNTGVNIVKQAIKFSLGEKINPEDLLPKYHLNISQRYIFSTPGKVVSIKGVNKVRNRKYVEFLDIRIKEGDIIPEVVNHLARAGVIICSGNYREEAIQNAKRSVTDIIIKTIN